MKKIKYKAYNPSGLLLTTSQGYSTDLQFNSGVARIVSDDDAELILKSFPDGFELVGEKKPVKKKPVKTKEAKKEKPVKKKKGD